MTENEIVGDGGGPESPKARHVRKLALGSTRGGARHLPASLNYNKRVVPGIHTILSRPENGEYGCGGRRIPRRARSGCCSLLMTDRYSLSSIVIRGKPTRN